MSNPSNKPSGDDLLIHLTASLKSVQTCLQVFADHPQYDKFCQSQKSPEMAAINSRLLQQFDKIRNAAQSHLTPSYDVNKLKSNKQNRP